jgi:hypothetical protein
MAGRGKFDNQQGMSDDIFSGSADVNDNHGIHYGNPNDPIDDDDSYVPASVIASGGADGGGDDGSQPYVPMYDRNLQGEEKDAWDQLVKEEMKAMELQFSDQASKQTEEAALRRQYEIEQSYASGSNNPAGLDEYGGHYGGPTEIHEKQGKYGIYQQTDEVKLNLPNGTKAATNVTDQGFGQRGNGGGGGRDGPSIDRLERLQTMEYNKAHPTTIEVAKRAPPRMASIGRARTPVTEDDTVFNGIGKGEMSSNQKKLKQHEYMKQMNSDRIRRELYINQAAIGDGHGNGNGNGNDNDDMSMSMNTIEYNTGSPKRQIKIDRSYRTIPEAPGDNYTSTIDKLATNGGSGSTSNSNSNSNSNKRAKQLEYQESLKQDAIMRDKLKGDNTIISSPSLSSSRGGQNLNSNSSRSVPYSPDRGVTPSLEQQVEQKRIKQQQYRLQLQQQSSVNEREKQVRLDEIRDRRLQQQRDADIEMIKQQEYDDKNEILKRNDIAKREQYEKEEYYKQIEKQKQYDEEEQLKKQKILYQQKLARDHLENGVSGTTYKASGNPTLPLHEKAELLVKKERQEKYKQEMDRDAALYGNKNMDIDIKDTISRKEKMDAYVQSASTSTTDIFNGLGKSES